MSMHQFLGIHISMFNNFAPGEHLLFSAELKPRGYYLEHFFYLDHVIFTNMSHVYYLDQSFFIMSHEYYLDCVEFYLSHVYYLDCLKSPTRDMSTSMSTLTAWPKVFKTFLAFPKDCRVVSPSSRLAVFRRCFLMIEPCVDKIYNSRQGSVY